ncbi:PTS fructose transporter subunit IIA [Clostridium beijerinckii]|uniref:PTS system mannose-specific EIIAB component n=1 Tax=Clostridium beijerinckii TaxID=1520 RepID=A0A1S8RRB6_CLOBE|nr:PTS fructose transporter subunit IIA [Clostridium beijerinckii]MDG5856307.1 PTS fructose transporter subunit IIA [Clostridium beijerinckii]NRY63926.1 PTS system N-acetylgalactosamine-specific IIA component [Clostridium beijerinckii]OOM55730.1 PTS system mannose-specific EIIAB component [Clostridium beijerinckii]
MKTNIIVTGHGNYGTGVESSIKLLSGHNERVEFIDFLEEDTDDTLKDKIVNSLVNNEADQNLFICDILGGTPFKVCVELSYEKENMEVVAGCNIGAILEGILLKDSMGIVELADSVVNATKDTAVRFTKVNIATNSADNNGSTMDDGI